MLVNENLYLVVFFYTDDINTTSEKQIFYVKISFRYSKKCSFKKVVDY